MNFAGLRRTGKNTATTMAHATSTTRLRMTHDGSMWFLERAEAFSLFFFFFFSAESARQPINVVARSELPLACCWLGGIVLPTWQIVSQCEAM
eukprot:COSAG06_NODE_7244_length_2573_cov_2.809620_1_plen_93_part_00